MGKKTHMGPSPTENIIKTKQKLRGRIMRYISAEKFSGNVCRIP